MRVRSLKSRSYSSSISSPWSFIGTTRRRCPPRLQELPGFHDVGVVLIILEDDFVAFAHEGLASRKPQG